MILVSVVTHHNVCMWCKMKMDLDKNWVLLNIVYGLTQILGIGFNRKMVSCVVWIS
jgi:hypothetical protein